MPFLQKQGTIHRNGYLEHAIQNYQTMFLIVHRIVL
ncbi:hypothetical protein T03_1011, partial [Trichinella britovi]